MCYFPKMSLKMFYLANFANFWLLYIESLIVVKVIDFKK